MGSKASSSIEALQSRLFPWVKWKEVWKAATRSCGWIGGMDVLVDAIGSASDGVSFMISSVDGGSRERRNKSSHGQYSDVEGLSLSRFLTSSVGFVD